MARVTMHKLREDVQRLRRWTGINYRLDIAYGRPRLVMESPPGYEPYSGMQHVSPRLSTGQLRQWIYAYMDGLQHAQELDRLRVNYPAEDVKRPLLKSTYRRNPREGKTVEKISPIRPVKTVVTDRRTGTAFVSAHEWKSPIDAHEGGGFLGYDHKGMARYHPDWDFRFPHQVEYNILKKLDVMPTHPGEYDVLTDKQAKKFLKEMQKYAFEENPRKKKMTLKEAEEAWNRNEVTTAEVAEAWWREQGKKVPRKETKAYSGMYEAWARMAFADFSD